MENDCIFCAIVADRSKGLITAESENCLAFMDRYPFAKGHQLVIPKTHYENLFDIPEQALQELISLTKKLAIKTKKSLNADGVNILQASGKAAQQSVMHFHMHIVPRFVNDNNDMNFHGNYQADFEEIKEVQKQLGKFATNLASL